jgi:hypothetical protein
MPASNTDNMGKLFPATRDDLSRETGSCHACLTAQSGRVFAFLPAGR